METFIIEKKRAQRTEIKVLNTAAPAVNQTIIFFSIPTVFEAYSLPAHLILSLILKVALI